MKKSRKYCIQSLYRTPVPRKLESKWHARISNAIDSGKLPEAYLIDVVLFKAWAYQEWIDDLASAPNSYVAQAVSVHSPVEVKSTLEHGHVTLPPKSNASEEELRKTIEDLQIDISRRDIARNSVEDEMKSLRSQRRKSSQSGKKGGRGKAK